MIKNADALTIYDSQADREWKQTHNSLLMENNRRNNERTSITLETVLESASGKRESRISDISVSGCFVDSIISPNKGEIVVLSLRIPSGDWMKLNGEVVYVYPGIGFGIRFTRISEEETAQIEQVILAHHRT